MSSSLQLFWDLSSPLLENRITACTKLIVLLKNEQETLKTNDVNKLTELNYSIKRLLKGLYSSNEASRQGYALALTEILKNFNILNKEQDILDYINSYNNNEKSSQQDKRDYYYGRIFIMLVLVRSKKWNLLSFKNVSTIIKEIRSFGDEKNWINEFVYESIIILITNYENIALFNDYLITIFDSEVNVNLLSLFLALKIHYKNINKAFPFNSHKFNHIFDSKENMVELIDSCQDVILSHPKMHSIFPRILSLYKVETYWPLFTAFLGFTNQHKYLVFNVLLECMKSPANFPIIFNREVVKALAREASAKKQKLNAIAIKVLDEVKLLGQASLENNSNFRMVIINCFMSVDFDFDNSSHTKTISCLLADLTTDELNEHIKNIMKVFEDPVIVVDETEGGYDTVENRQKKKLSNRQISCVRQLCALVRNPKIPRNESWVFEIVKFLFRYAFFLTEKQQEVTKSSKKEKKVKAAVENDSVKSIFVRLFFSLILVNIDADARETTATLFFTVLSELLNSSQFSATKDSEDKKPKRELGLMEDGNSWLYAINLYWQSLKCTPQAEFSDEANETRKDMFQTVEKLRKKKSKNDGNARLLRQYRAFELLFLYIGLLQLIPKSADEAREVLGELQECYKNAFKKSEDPDFINVLVDIMISLLTKSSSVLRDIVRIVFTAFSDILNEESLQCLVRVLLPGKNDESDDESGDDEDEEDDSEGDIDDGAMDVINNLDNEVDEKEKKPKRVNTHNEKPTRRNQSDSESEEEGSDDEEETIDLFSTNLDLNELEIYDDHLANMIALRKEQTSGKKDLKLQTVNFKLRVLELIELFIKKQPSSPALISLFQPLTVALNGNKSASATLAARLGSVYTKYINNKEMVCNDPEILLSMLTQLTDLMKKAHNSQHTGLFKNAIISAIRIIISPKHFTEESFSNIVEVLTTSVLGPFFSHSAKYFNSSFFGDLFSRFPMLGWKLFNYLVQQVPVAKSTYLSIECLEIISSIIHTHKNFADSSAILNQNIGVFISGLQTVIQVEKAQNKIKSFAKVLNEYLKLITTSDGLSITEKELSNFIDIYNSLKLSDKDKQVVSNSLALLGTVRELSKNAVPKSTENKKRKKSVSEEKTLKALKSSKK